ncbi:MAG TPA: hypothetical protein VJT78_05240 [Candidatus Dormibacteraeota bacterium]|nr:hypothetical protein [Candidatus Dormibacteraeota bacterium]
MKSLRWPLLAVAAVLALVPITTLADNGESSPTLSFFSGGGGAQAHWIVTADQPPGDTDKQAIEIHTTTTGSAGVLVHHVTGIPATAFPDSSYWVKGPAGATLGSPRLIVTFQTPAGTPDGDAQLTPNAFTGDWQFVSDTFLPHVQNGWDIHSATCPFVYHDTWTTAQACHVNDTVSSVYIVTDPYGITYLVDDITVDGKSFSSASDNGGGINDAAGPAATMDTSLLPPLLFPPF